MVSDRLTGAHVTEVRPVMKTLDDMGPSKLLESEQQRIRYAADNLIFSVDLSTDLDAQDALEDVSALCRVLVENGRWEQATAMRLVDDICECGPPSTVLLQAA